MPAPCPTAPRRTTGAGSRCGPGGRGRSPVDEGVLRGGHRRRQLRRVRDVLEVRDVLGVLHCRLVWGRRLQPLKRPEVKRREPLVFQDVAGPILEVPEALAEVRGKQLLHQRLRVLVEVLREVDLPGQDLLVDAHGVLVAEGRLAADHLVDEDAQGPPVHGLAVALVQQHLGRDVLRRAAERVRPRAWLDDLCKAEICELGVAVLAHQDVLWLQVAVDDVLGVDVREGGRRQRGVELGLLVRELAGPPEVHEELASADALHDDVDVAVVLGVAEHVDDEGIVDLRHQPLLVVDVVHLLELDDLLLLHELHGVVLVVLLVLGVLDPAKRAAPQRPDHRKVREVHLLGHLRGERIKHGVLDSGEGRSPGAP
mmetsp:Transcript_36225/g.111497  ORF Transcript_36225/g.111497 Transcript_36225/m.111497 type:complete len:369 (-) Transcript_36225:59-1165(-)